MNLKINIRLLLVLALISGGAIALAFRLDAPVREALVTAQGKDWKKSTEKKVYSAIRIWGDWPPLMGAAFLGFLIAKWKGHARWRRIILAAMIASTLAGALANASRLTTGRTRPRESPKIEQGFYGLWHNGKSLIGNSAYNSFPSGHTATAFGFAAVIVLASPAWGALALIGAAAVAWSSIAIGAHHPSDVTVSIALSFLVAWVVWRWFEGRIVSEKTTMGC